MTSEALVSTLRSIRTVQQILLHSSKERLFSNIDVTAAYMELLFTLLMRAHEHTGDSYDLSQMCLSSLQQVMTSIKQHTGLQWVQLEPVTTVIRKHVWTSSSFLDTGLQSEHAYKVVMLLRQIVEVYTSGEPDVACNEQAMSSTAKSSEKQSSETSTENALKSAVVGNDDVALAMRTFYENLFDCSSFAEMLQDDTRRAEQGPLQTLLFIFRS